MGKAAREAVVRLVVQLSWSSHTHVTLRQYFEQPSYGGYAALQYRLLCAMLLLGWTRVPNEISRVAWRKPAVASAAPVVFEETRRYSQTSVMLAMFPKPVQHSYVDAHVPLAGGYRLGQHQTRQRALVCRSYEAACRSSGHHPPRKAGLNRVLPTLPQNCAACTEDKTRPSALVSELPVSAPKRRL